MGKSQHFQPVQFALLFYDATGAVVGGTISQRDLDGTRRLAESVLRVMPGAATVWIHPWLGTTYAASCTEVVRRPASMESEAAPDPVILVDDPLVEVETAADQMTAAIDAVFRDNLPVEQEAAPNVSDIAPDVAPVAGVAEEPSSEEPAPAKRRRGRPPRVTVEA